MGTFFFRRCVFVRASEENEKVMKVVDAWVVVNDVVFLVFFLPCTCTAVAKVCRLCVEEHQRVAH